MKYQDASRKLAGYRRQIETLRRRMRKTQAAIEPEAVTDYALATPGGTVRLSELFGDRSELLIIHNMGAGCSSCTLWADGFNGVYEHLANRAAFVVASPDPPAAQKRFAAKRGWRFPMVSHQSTSFAADLGYRSPSGGFRPGVSVLRREGGQIVRVADTGFEPHDDFCVVWHLLDLFPEGAAGWHPRFSYP